MPECSRGSVGMNARGRLWLSCWMIGVSGETAGDGEPVIERRLSPLLKLMIRQTGKKGRAVELCKLVAVVRQQY